MKTKLSIQGNKFLINDRLSYSEFPRCPQEYQGLLMNARFIQGIFDDQRDKARFNRFGRTFDAEQNTEELITALHEWYQYGIRAITVGFQGGGTCFTIDNRTIDNNPFQADGTTIDAAYLRRLKKIIAAADELGMVVIVSYFYGIQSHFLIDDRAVMAATKAASNWLRDNSFSNVIIEIANEHDLDEFKVHPIIHNPQGIIQLIEIARRESGGIPIGCSSTVSFSSDIAKVSDVVLVHGNNFPRQVFYNLIKEAKVAADGKPIVCNEDSQALGGMQVALDMGVSWGYYNNMTKQEPPVDWGITKGEDSFFALRLAASLGIKEHNLKLEEQFYLQGLEKDNCYQNERWIRLASLYPERIHKVDFYRNGSLVESAYNDPFTINYVVNWYQKPSKDIAVGEIWKAVITLSTGEVVTKETTVE